MRFPSPTTYHVLPVLAAVLALTIGAWAWAGENFTPIKLVDPAVAEAPAPVPSKAKTDTLNLYGGPGTLEGKFQTIDGQPDEQGWTPIDETASGADPYWHISDYQAANLDPITDNLAWWCGDLFPACPDGDSEGGYGNSWDESLTYASAVNDPAVAATVTVAGILNLDTEPGYDFVSFLYETAGGIHEVWTMDGGLTGHEFSFELAYPADSYLGSGNDEVFLSFKVISDGGWSDEDCSYPSVGAAQIDNLQVTISQDGYPDLVSPVETCQPGDPLQWQPTTAPGCGNFGQLWTGLDDIDPDQDNHSPQWAFIDDGLIVPGTGGSLCVTWCYGPDGYVVNGTGGLCGEGSTVINSVLSPPIKLPRSPFKSLVASWDAFLHADPEAGAAGFMSWSLETTADPTGLTGWESYNSDSVYYADGNYIRVAVEVDQDDLAGNACFARIRMGVLVFELWIWGRPVDMTPAPYFDNVRLQAVKKSGKEPEVETEESLEITCHPNPFNPAVTISYVTQKAGNLEVKIFDIRGKLVDILYSGRVAAGPGQVTWLGTDRQGHNAASGVYFCQVQTQETSRTKKIILAK